MKILISQVDKMQSCLITTILLKCLTLDPRLIQWRASETHLFVGKFFRQIADECCRFACIDWNIFQVIFEGLSQWKREENKSNRCNEYHRSALSLSSITDTTTPCHIWKEEILLYECPSHHPSFVVSLLFLSVSCCSSFFLFCHSLDDLFIHIIINRASCVHFWFDACVHRLRERQSMTDYHL